MPARGQKAVKQFRGILRAQMKKGDRALVSILTRNTKAKVAFLTANQLLHLQNAQGDLDALLAQKINV